MWGFQVHHHEKNLNQIKIITEKNDLNQIKNHFKNVIWIKIKSSIKSLIKMSLFAKFTEFT